MLSAWRTKKAVLFKSLEGKGKSSFSRWNCWNNHDEKWSYGSSLPKVLCKWSVRKLSIKFIGKHLLWSLLLIFHRRCFPVNYMKMSKTAVLKNTCELVVLSLVWFTEWIIYLLLVYRTVKSYIYSVYISNISTRYLISFWTGTGNIFKWFFPFEWS